MHVLRPESVDAYSRNLFFGHRYSSTNLKKQNCFFGDSEDEEETKCIQVDSKFCKEGRRHKSQRSTRDTILLERTKKSVVINSEGDSELKSDFKMNRKTVDAKSRESRGVGKHERYNQIGVDSKVKKCNKYLEEYVIQMHGDGEKKVHKSNQDKNTITEEDPILHFSALKTFVWDMAVLYVSIVTMIFLSVFLTTWILHDKEHTGDLSPNHYSLPKLRKEVQETVSFSGGGFHHLFSVNVTKIIN